MNEVTQLLTAARAGDTSAGRKLLPLAYDELKRLARKKMSEEREGHTLQPTALVHEAYLRLAGPEGKEPNLNSRGHFFSAAAEAMRRILIESARRKGRQKRGGGFERITWEESIAGISPLDEEMLAVDEALKKLETEDAELARLVKLRYFAGMTIAETASVLGISPRSVNRQWECAKAWLYCEISGDS